METRELGSSPVRTAATTVRFVLGLVVIALGLAFLGDNLDWFDGDQLVIRVIWPVACVMIGIAVLTQSGRRGSSRWFGWLWILAGAWIFAHHQGWIDLSVREVIFPAALLLIGGSLIWRSLSARQATAPASDFPILPANAAATTPPFPASESEAFPRAFAVMAGNEIRSTSSAFRGADLGAIMGGVVLDLRDAKMAGTEATIDAWTVWGSIELRVPQEWTVVSQVMPLMAGYEDKTRPSSATATHRLVIRGFAMMAGIEVTN